jgi:hypothetical protein
MEAMAGVLAQWGLESLLNISQPQLSYHHWVATPMTAGRDKWEFRHQITAMGCTDLTAH